MQPATPKKKKDDPNGMPSQVELPHPDDAEEEADGSPEVLAYQHYVKEFRKRGASTFLQSRFTQR